MSKNNGPWYVWLGVASTIALGGVVGVPRLLDANRNFVHHDLRWNADQILSDDQSFHELTDKTVLSKSGALSVCFDENAPLGEPGQWVRVKDATVEYVFPGEKETRTQTIEKLIGMQWEISPTQPTCVDLGQGFNVVSFELETG